MYGALDIRTVPGTISRDKSTSLSSGILGNSTRNTFGNFLTTGIFSTSTRPLLESSIKAKNASYPFLINLLAYMAEITLDSITI